MISFVCPGCGHRYTLDEKYWGAMVRCSGCKRQFYIGVRGNVKPDDDIPAVPVVAAGGSSDVVGKSKEAKMRAGAGIQEPGQHVLANNASGSENHGMQLSPYHSGYVAPSSSVVSSAQSAAPGAFTYSAGGIQPAPGSESPKTFSFQDTTHATVQHCGDWSRLFARALDFEIGYWVIVLSLGMLVAGTSWEKRLESLPALVDVMLTLPLCYLVEGGMYAILQTTPGKLLMGVSIVDRNLRPLNGLDYFKRNILVWVMGTGMGVPLLSICMICYQSQRLKKGRPTVYDEKLGTQAIAKGGSFIKTAFGGVLLVLSIWLRAWLMTQ